MANLKSVSGGVWSRRNIQGSALTVGQFHWGASGWASGRCSSSLALATFPWKSSPKPTEILWCTSVIEREVLVDQDLD